MENNKAFAFLEKYLMGPMGKMSQCVSYAV